VAKTTIGSPIGPNSNDGNKGNNPKENMNIHTIRTMMLITPTSFRHKAICCSRFRIWADPRGLVILPGGV
jgi:hypothetical protein